MTTNTKTPLEMSIEAARNARCAVRQLGAAAAQDAVSKAFNVVGVAILASRGRIGADEEANLHALYAEMAALERDGQEIIMTIRTANSIRSLLSHAESTGDVQTAGICRRALAGDEGALDQAIDRLSAHEEVA